MNRKPKEPSIGMRSDQALASNGIDPDVRREILRRLAVIESEEEVRIAYAREYLYEGQVRLKEYFYVLRPLLAIRYIETGRGIPPVRFEELVDAVAPVAIRPGIGKLLKQKRATSEMGRGKQIPELGRFIEAELDRHGESLDHEPHNTARTSTGTIVSGPASYGLRLPSI